MTRPVRNLLELSQLVKQQTTKKTTKKSKGGK